MRTLFTALAFGVILWAVIPAVKRSLLPMTRTTTNPDATAAGRKT